MTLVILFFGAVVLLCIFGLLAAVLFTRRQSEGGRGAAGAGPAQAGEEILQGWREAHELWSNHPSGGSAAYRVRPGKGGQPKWNPYAAEQSREHRVRTARTRAQSGVGDEALHRPRDPQGYYALLGVEPGAGHAEIERAFRRAIAAIHPDKFQHDPVRRALAEEQVKRLNSAMAVLRDPVERARYDAEA